MIYYFIIVFWDEYENKVVSPWEESEATIPELAHRMLCKSKSLNLAWFPFLIIFWITDLPFSQVTVISLVLLIFD